MRPFLLALMTMSMSSLAEDWPQYLGTGRDAVWREQEVELDFAKRAPRLVWSVAVGSGYAGPSVAKGRVFVMDRQAKPYVTEKLKPGSNVNFARGRIPGWSIGDLTPNESGLLNPGADFSSPDGGIDTEDIRDCVSEANLAGDGS